MKGIPIRQIPAAADKVYKKYQQQQSKAKHRLPVNSDAKRSLKKHPLWQCGSDGKKLFGVPSFPLLPSFKVGK